MMWTEPEFRHRCPAEPIEFVGHQAACRYCHDESGDPGIVKMERDKDTLDLLPNKCWCLLCGQHYYVEIVGDIDDWEDKQWGQKAARRERL